MMNIFLIGFMGSGKSTVASYMANNFAMEIVEMDELIASREGMSISNIFETYGETYFRDLESALLKECQCKPNQVISCGGGVVLRDENVRTMKENGRIVLLTATAQTILKRVANDEGRPLLQGKKTIEDIEKLMEVRREKYEAAADIVISTDDKSTLKICEEIRMKMKEIQGE